MTKTIRKYRVPAIIALIAALVFLFVSIIVWVFLIFHAFGNKNLLVTDENLQMFYQIGLIATTITFGLFTVHFALRSSQNSFSDRQTNLMVRINDFLADYFKSSSSPSFQYVKLVCRDIVETFNLQTVLDNFENIQDSFWNMCQDLFMNSQYVLPDVLVDSAKAYMSISTDDGDVPEWFSSKKNIDDKVFDYFLMKFIEYSNKCEAMAYPYINETIDEEIFEEQILSDVRFIFLMSLIFQNLGVIAHPEKSISYQALKKFKEKCDIIKAKKKGEK